VIGAEKVPQRMVFNKIDLTGDAARLDREGQGRPARVWVSALTGAGFPELRAAVAELARDEIIDGWLHLDAAQGRVRARLFDLGAVREEEHSAEGGWNLHVRMPLREYRQLVRHESLEANLEQH